jgi:hypothetical protein
LKEKKTKIALVITDGVGFRNFVLSDFLNEASKAFDEIVVFSGLPKSSFENFTLSNCIIEELEDFREKPKTWFFRKLKEIAHLQLHKNNNFGISDNLKSNYPKQNTKKGILTKFIFAWTYFFNSEYWINTYWKLQKASLIKSKVTKGYIELLKKYNPDTLFFTHQRPAYVAPITVAAESLKIKTTTFIFSWDNLASKGRMGGDFDAYFVWSDLMKKELLEFYTRLKENQIEIVGTPQFEPYVLEKYQVDKTTFIKKFDLDSNKRIICYSCADSSIGGNDDIHIRAIWNYILKHQDLQLIVRTSPAEDGSRFQTLKKDIPQIKWNIPKWKQTRRIHAESWSQRLPTVEDVIDLKSMLSFSDVNVNMLSTMSLDFMIFNKPVVNTVFGNKENGLFDDQRFLDYVHYKYMIDSKAVVIAKNENELHQGLDEALNAPQKWHENMKNILDLEIGKPIKGTSKRIVEALLK